MAKDTQLITSCNANGFSDEVDRAELARALERLLMHFSQLERVSQASLRQFAC